MGYSDRVRRYEEEKKTLPPMPYKEYEQAIKALIKKYKI